jgi:elongation factor Ts
MITTKEIQELREKSGAGPLECKKALAETSGDMQKAMVLLRERGIIRSSNPAITSRNTSNGIVTSYIHTGNKVGVLLEIACETDFVAKNEKFQELARELCLQITAMRPRWIKREDVDVEVVEQESSFHKKQLLQDEKNKNKPEAILTKIVEGKMNKFYEENCLLEQLYVRSQDKQKVNELVKTTIAATGENIVVRRFTRYTLGE